MIESIVTYISYSLMVAALGIVAFAGGVYLGIVLRILMRR